MTQTTFDIPEDLLKQFNIKVVKERGMRKRNQVLEELIRNCLKND
jgi:metal-responsive CopG/Arc/MetJ family transcriptional regulator